MNDTAIKQLVLLFQKHYILFCKTYFEVYIFIISSTYLKYCKY